MKPYFQDGACTIYCGDCREILPELSSVNLVATDPPFGGVLDADWDNQWSGDAEFLDWSGGVLRDLVRCSTDNSTIYWFASPRIASRLEARFGDVARVIGSCVWDKGQSRQGAAGTGIDISALRTYWTSDHERIIVAEKFGGDECAQDAAGYVTACERAKVGVIGSYLRQEFERAGVTNRTIAALFPSKSGGLTGCVSNWLLGLNFPTAQQYGAMRAFLNRGSGEYLRHEYEYLRREYEELRHEYEELRRPFFAKPWQQWGSIWRFAIPKTRQHPCEKPVALMSQIITISSRPNDLVLDPFAGSGTTLVAAKLEGRRSIGIELEERWCEVAAKRLAQEVLPFTEALKT